MSISLYNLRLRGADNKAIAGATLDLSPITYAGLKLPNSGATAATYGDGTHYPVITVDASGRITSVTSQGFSAGGTVTSVSLALPAIFSVSGSPVTGSGTLTAALATQAANLVFAGPSSGAAAAPTFRALVVADLPAGASQITSIGLTMPAVFTVAGSPLTSNGSITVGWNATLGDVLYGSASNVFSRLAGNTTAAVQFLSQTGTGTVSAAPAWSSIGTSLSFSANTLNTIQDIRTTATPQFTRIGIGAAADSTQPLIIQQKSPIPAGVPGAAVHITNITGGGASFLADSDADGNPVFIGRRCLGTFASPSAVLAGTNLLIVQGRGYGATAYGTASPGFRVVAGENWSDTAQGTFFQFIYTPSGNVNPSEGMRLSMAGNILIGTNVDTGLTGSGGLSVGSTTDATASNAAAFVVAGGVGAGGKIIGNSSIQTGAPTGGTAGAWKFGIYVAGAPAATGYVQLDIGGTLYKLLTST